MYVDLGVETSLTDQDERWVGNWWIGFIIFSVVSAIVSVCLFAFPKQLSGTTEMRKVVYERGESEVRKQTKSQLKLGHLISRRSNLKARNQQNFYMKQHETTNNMSRFLQIFTK